MSRSRGPQRNDSLHFSTHRPRLPRRCNSALAAECAELAATPKGERNLQLWESARNLYNLVAGGVLDAAEVDQAIRHAAHRCGLLQDEPRQTEATLASARQVGLAHPRGLPDPTPTNSSPPRPVQPAPERAPER